MPMGTSAASDVNFSAVIIDNEAAINGISHPFPDENSVFGDIIIPESIEYMGVMFPVTRIMQDAFRSAKLTSLTIPDFVTTIDSNAFRYSEIETLNIQSNITKLENNVFYCSDIKNINLPESITEIGDSTFSYSKFKNITLPKNIKKIGAKAFYDCYNLESINIPNGVEKIGSEAFGHTNIKSIAIPDSVTEIANGAFSSCMQLTSVKLGNGITTIKEETFNYCPSLKSVVVPNSVIKIEKFAFANCFALENITLSENINYIGEKAFLSCRALKSIAIPSKVTTIEEKTFCDCTGLQSLKIGKNVTTICGNPFAGCASLASLTVEKGNPNYYSVDNCIIDKRNKTLIKGGKNSIIPSDSSVTTIGESAFEGVPLVSVDLPKEIIVLEDRAFAQIDTLKSVNIPEGVTKIGTNAFVGCLVLEKVYIPKSVTYIGNNVFTYCDKLVIYGTNGSYAQTYAKSNNIKFVSSSHTHSYGKWIKTKEPSCTESGSQQHVCSSCGNVETKAINALGHDLENIKIIKEATISETGIKEGVCKNCKQTIKETIPCSSVDDETGATFETAAGVLETGAEIKIKEIKTDSETYKLIQNSLKEISTKFVAYDVTAVLNGAEIQPNGSIKITLKIPDNFSQNVAVYYVADDGTSEKLESTVNADGTISANINHFSSYVICDLDVIKNTVTNEKNSNAKQTPKNNVSLYIVIVVAMLVVTIAAVITILLIKKRKNILIAKTTLLDK